MRGGALSRIAFTGVLLHHDPAVEIGRLQRAHDCRDVDHPGPERAEDDPAQCIGETQTLRPRARQDSRIDVLQVEVTDQVAVLAHELGRIAAPVRVVASVEAK